MIWNTSGTYSQSDMLRMQQDAINRVHEMQRRAQRTIEETNGSIQHVHDAPQSPAPLQAAHHAPPRRHGEPAPHHAPEKPVNPLSNLLSALNFDSEQILIGILLVMLINEGADMPIILALLYLLLF